MRKSVCKSMAVLAVISVLSGCSSAGGTASAESMESVSAEQVSEEAVDSNGAAWPSTGKIVINYEGTIVLVEEDHVTLESGQIVYFTEDTVFSNAEGIVDNVVLSEGDYIQGYTEDDAEAEKITAARVHVVG